jgi:hypothetical protein
MKSRLIALALFAITTATVALLPAYQSAGGITPIDPPPVTGATPNERSRIDVVFVLDTTGSMGGLIQAAKEKIWSIATTLASAHTVTAMMPMLPVWWTCPATWIPCTPR